MIKKIRYILILSFMALLMLCTKSQARITTNDPTVSSGETVTITINSQEGVAYGAIDVTSNGGLTFVSVSGGQVNGTLIAFAGTENKTSGIATYTFKAPTVTKTQTYKIVFQSKDMGNIDGEEIESSTATATVTVKAPANTENNTSNSGNSNNKTPSSTPTFTSVNQTVYATEDDINVRANYSTESTKLGTLAKGDSVTRIGIGTNGWSKVTYKGQTAYIVSEYLSTTKPEKKSDNNNLKSLTVTPVGLTPDFGKEITEYKMAVGAEVDKIEVNAVAEDEKAKVSISGNNNLVVGDNIIEVKVTAEDGTAKTYKIMVTKKEKEQEKLKELLIEGLPLEPEFDSDIYEYTLTLDKNDISELNITATPSNDKSSVEIVGNTDLKEGLNVVTILVKSEDEEETTTYQITVKIPEKIVASVNNNEKTYTYIGIGVAVAILIIIIIVVVMKNRKKDDFDKFYGDYNLQTNDSKNSDQDKEENEEELPKSLRKSKKEKEKQQEEAEENTNDAENMEEEVVTSKKNRGKHF